MAKRRKQKVRKVRTVRKRSRRARTQRVTAVKAVENRGLRAMGETDLVAGILLTLLGGIAVTYPGANGIMTAVGSAVVILGVILTGFGIGDYVSGR
jgi:hypothetical protein